MPNYDRAIARLKETLRRQEESVQTTKETIAALERFRLHIQDSEEKLPLAHQSKK